MKARDDTSIWCSLLGVEGRGGGSLNVLAIERMCGQRNVRLSIVTSVDKSNEVGAERDIGRCRHNSFCCRRHRPGGKKEKCFFFHTFRRQKGGWGGGTSCRTDGQLVSSSRFVSVLSKYLVVCLVCHPCIRSLYVLGVELKRGRKIPSTVRWVTRGRQGRHKLGGSMY